MNKDNPWYAIELNAEPDKIILDDDMEDYPEEIWQPYEEEAVKPEAEDYTPEELDKYIPAQ
eukprot:10714258-Ditylum_brightwellii.AAC.1